MARPIEPLADYSRFSLPTLIVWGRRDRLVPIALGQRLACETSGVQFVAFDKCGHLPQEESPRETAEVIARFVGTMPSGPTGSYGWPRRGRDHRQPRLSSTPDGCQELAPPSVKTHGKLAAGDGD